MKKKIMIIYTNYGTGHYQAAKAIENELSKWSNKVSILAFDPLTYSRPIINKLFAKIGKLLATKLQNNRQLLYNKKMYQDYLKESKFAAFCVKLFWTKRVKNKIQQFNPDLIISTQVGPTGLMAVHKHDKINAKLISVFTDYGIHRWYVFPHKAIDLYCVPSSSIKEEMLKLGIEESKVKATGIPVSTVFDKSLYNRLETLNNYHLPKDKPLLLFVCGGGLGYRNGLNYFQKMLEIGDDFSYIFVAGKNQQLEQEMNSLASKYKVDGVVLGYVNNMAELINASDLVIGKPGGLLTSESLAMNKPFCAVNPIPGQEIKNAEFLINNNFGFYVQNEEEFVMLIKNIIKNSKMLRQLSKNIEEKAIKNSTKNICEICLDLLKIK